MVFFFFGVSRSSVRKPRPAFIELHGYLFSTYNVVKLPGYSDIYAVRFKVSVACGECRYLTASCAPELRCIRRRWCRSRFSHGSQIGKSIAILYVSQTFYFRTGDYVRSRVKSVYFEGTRFSVCYLSASETLRSIAASLQNENVTQM